MKKKKLLAVLTAAMVSVTAVPTAVQAGESYKDTEKAVLEALLEDISASYTKEMDAYAESLSGIDTGADITLSLGDAGKSLLGMIAPVDVSWLSDIQFQGDVSFTDKNLAEVMDVNVNGTKICTMEVFMDTESMDTYVRIPELADGYIKANAMDAANAELKEAENSLEDEGSAQLDGMMEDSSQFMSEYMETLASLEEILPDPETVNTLIDRYASLLISYFKEGENEIATETLTVSGVSQECPVYSGTFSQKEAVPAAADLLNTAKEDEELKGLIESLAEAMPSANISYDDFQSAIDSSLEELTSASEISDGSYFSSKIWMDSTVTKVVGRQISFTDETGTKPIFTWQSPKTDSSRAFLFNIGADNETFEFSGSGEMNGSLLNGYYEFFAGPTPLIGVEVTDFDTEALNTNGVLNGTYKFSILPAVGEDIYASFGSFGLTFKSAGGEKDGTVSLSLTSADVPLLSLTVAARAAKEVTFPDPASLENVYDTSIKEDGDRFTADMNPETILANLTAAGMPDGFIEALMNSGSEPEGSENGGNDISAGTGALSFH